MARESREVWAKRVERWRESGLRASEFAAELGVNAGTLAHWKYRLAAEARAEAPRLTTAEPNTVSFVEVKADAEPGGREPRAAESRFEVVLPSGITLRVPSQFDAAALRRLVDVITPR
jgi:hypothetical protein